MKRFPETWALADRRGSVLENDTRVCGVDLLRKDRSTFVWEISNVSLGGACSAVAGVGFMFAVRRTVTAGAFFAPCEAIWRVLLTWLRLPPNW